MNLSCVLVNMSRLQGGKSFLSAIKLLCDAIPEASNADMARYLQGLALCLIVDFTVSAPRTDSNSLCFSRGLELLAGAMKKSVYFDSQTLEECLGVADKYLSSPIVYIDPESDKFKQLVRYFLAELQDACLSAPQRTALLVDKILGCYLDMRPSPTSLSGISSEDRLEAWVLTLLSFSRTCLKCNALSTDRLIYIKGLLMDIQPELCCSRLSKHVSRFIMLVPVRGNTISNERRDKLLAILKKTIHSRVKSRKGGHCHIDPSLCSFPASGLLPFTHPYCAIPHFQESFNRFTYTSNVISIVTRINSVQSYPLSPNTTPNKSPAINIRCNNVPRFMTKEDFYKIFTEHFAFNPLVSITIDSYAMTDTLTHTAFLNLNLNTNTEDTSNSERLAIFDSTISTLAETPELVVWGHAIKLIVFPNYSNYSM